MACSLAIDTVSARPALSLLYKGQMHTRRLGIGRKQSQSLLDELEKLFQVADCSLQDITDLIVLTGPGSFTGIRVGLSFFKGLSIGLDIPLYGMNHFELIKRFLPYDKNGLIVLESGRDQKFGQFFQDGKLIDEPFNEDMDDIIKLFPELYSASSIFITDMDGLPPEGIETHKYPAETTEILIENIGQACLKPAPFYIRDADTSTPKKNII